MSTRLEAWGIQTDLPRGWEGRISRRQTPHAVTDQLDLRDTDEARMAGPTLGTTPVLGAAPVASDGHVEEQMSPVVHLANFPLPAQRGDFGSGAVERMNDRGALIVLFEYGPECVGTALFAARGLPRSLDPGRFTPSALQRRLPGQGGYQHFFTDAGRAFCLYVVLGALRNAPELCAASSRTLAATRISNR